ncbi:MAG: tetratricopeptide repeat protein [Chitinophagales bacterium]|nr:tetratricopeptide repeat protein [Chitinophagales bacterium]
MIKKLLPTFLLLFLFNCLHAQNAETDSLINLLNTTTADTTKADLAWKLCIAFQEDDPDKAIDYADLSYAAALKANDKLREGKALHQKGVSYDYKNNLDSCLIFLQEAKNIFESINATAKESNVISDIGMAYYHRGNYELALRNYLKGLELRQQVGDKMPISRSYNNIGLVYRSRKDYPNAIKYYTASLAIKTELNDEQGILNTLMNIGSLYLHSENYDSAYVYASKALVIAEKLDRKKDILNSKANMGSALVAMKQREPAKKLLLEVQQEAKAINYAVINPTVNEALGNIALEENDITLAIKYFSTALNEATEIQSLEKEAIFSKILSKTYQRKGDYKSAFEYLTQSKNAYDTLYNEENSRQINELSAVYETTEKEKEIQQLNLNSIVNTTQIKAREKERNYFILSTILFLVLAGVAYKAFTNNRRKKEMLNAQNKIIETSLSEKELLLREIHHRVKNNLQIVSSLLSLQSNYISDEKALDAVRESKNRVQSMAIIHENLYKDDKLANISVKTYVENLTSYLFHSYNIRDEKIKLEMDIQPMQLDVDTLVPLGLILNELINNCLKYAFQNEHTGIIEVTLKQEGELLKLEVNDNGIGFEGDASHFNQNSFGHKMINAFIKKLKGEMKIYSNNGTHVAIEIKNQKAIMT